MSLDARTRISVSFAFLHIFFTIDAFCLFNLTDILQNQSVNEKIIIYATIIEIKSLLSYDVFTFFSVPFQELDCTAWML